VDNDRTEIKELSVAEPIATILNSLLWHCYLNCVTRAVSSRLYLYVVLCSPMSGQKYQYFANADADDHLVASSSAGAAVSYGSPVVSGGRSTDVGLDIGEGQISSYVNTTTYSRHAPAVNYSPHLCLIN